MPKLILSMDGLVLKEITLDKERISIGRKPNNDIQIDNLAISGQHALITTLRDDSFLEDQNSTNGTYLNGQPVKKCVLRDNDVIELGKYRLKYVADPAKPDAMGYIEPPSAIGTVPEDAEPEETRLGVIRILTGPTAGRELPLSKAQSTLGKPGIQVAVITRRPQGYFIAHAEGDAQPQVNNRPIEPGPRLLKDKDIIEIAGVRMAFSLRGSVADGFAGDVR